MRQRCGMRLPGATGKAAPGAERGQRIRELTARGQCCGAAVRRQRGGFLILCSCATRHGVFLPVAELLVNFEAASSARVDRSPMEPGVSRGPWTVEILVHASCAPRRGTFRARSFETDRQDDIAERPTSAVLLGRCSPSAS